MRNLHLLDIHRVAGHPGGMGDGTCGMFDVPHNKSGVKLRVIASCDDGWDHVSVSLPHRCPNWPEMEYIRRLFFRDDECVVQIHAPVKDYVDGEGGRAHGHPYCLHLWRDQEREQRLPPRWMIVP